MVSIIVPVYHIADYLPNCVESLRNQTYADVEIILVDDGSRDGSGALCDQFAAEDSRFQVVHKQNGGLSSARNAGLDRASGQWVLFVDGDDYLVPWAVEKLVQIGENTDADFVQFLYHETPDTSWMPEEDQRANTVLVTELRQMYDRLYALGGVAASSCTKLLRRSLFAQMRFREGILHEDEELVTRLLPECRRVAYTDLELYGYVNRNGSIVHSAFKPKHMDALTVMDHRIDALRELGYEDLMRETQRRVFQTAAWQYCLARKGGFVEEAKALKARLVMMSKYKDLPLSGQYRVLYKLTGVTACGPELFYCLRRFLGKT